jgi:hypothetical protein
MDTSLRLYETVPVVRAGALRSQLAGTLRTAYAKGLLSEGTFSYRLELLFSNPLVDPRRLTGDLTLRSPARWWSRLGAGLVRRVERAAGGRVDAPIVLGLDWDGNCDELLLGRLPDCDVVLGDPTVSRRHARLNFRDGRWLLQDLESRNGTTVNGAPVGRCELRPGDRVAVGEQILVVD